MVGDIYRKERSFVQDVPDRTTMGRRGGKTRETRMKTMNKEAEIECLEDLRERGKGAGRGVLA